MTGTLRDARSSSRSEQTARIILSLGAPWPLRQADTIRASRGTPGSTAHSGSHASTVRPPRYPRIVPIGLLSSAELPFRGNRAVLGLGTKLAPTFGIRVAGDPTSVAVIHPSCPPVIMAYAFLDARAFVEAFAENCV